MYVNTEIFRKDIYLENLYGIVKRFPKRLIKTKSKKINNILRIHRNIMMKLKFIDYKSNIPFNENLETYLRLYGTEQMIYKFYSSSLNEQDKLELFYHCLLYAYARYYNILS